MLIQIILILFYWLYFIFEGTTEASIWWHHNKKINPKIYHIYRLLENLGIIGIILIIGFFQPDNWFLISIFSAISGLFLYERFFTLVTQNNFWFTKKWYWKVWKFNIPYPPVWVQVILFWISILILGKIIV